MNADEVLVEMNRVCWTLVLIPVIRAHDELAGGDPDHLGCWFLRHAPLSWA
jgi:hypothetical protein